MPCPCMQCMPCRVGKAKEWSSRLMLEKDNVSHSAFITLTYTSEELVHVDAENWTADKPLIPTLVPKHVQNWLKRLRQVVARTDGRSIRYFLVGEYGSDKGRPHYHAALFGFPSCLMGRTLRNRKGEAICCWPCKTIEKTWGLGRIDVGELNKDSASYITKYVTKKWTKEDTWTQQKLKGRHPEFVRMSLNPGIGADAIKSLVTTTVGTRSGKYLKMCSDAPVVLHRSGSSFPLGKYLRRKFREALGRSPDTPKQQIEEYVRRLQTVYEEDKAKAENEGVPRIFRVPREIYISKNVQRIRSLEAKIKIHTQKETL